MTPDLESSLREGARQLGLTLEQRQIDDLLAYLSLLQKWNKVYNLTAVRDPADMLTHHLLDSLALIEPLRQQLAAMRPAPEVSTVWRVLDVGSGAGLPGVVIAIACPEVVVDCVDAVAKKAAFIEQVAAALKRPNLHGLHARVESLSRPYSVICARAFASLPDFVGLSVGALAAQGVWLAMKGKHPAEEIAALPDTVEVFHVEPLQVPGLGAERCLLWLRQTPPTT